MIASLGNIQINPNQYWKYANFNKTDPINVTFNHDPNVNYTLLIVDENNPKPYMIHQLVINNNTTIHKYQPPSPPKNSGPHHYHILILEQNEKINDLNDLPRISFDPHDFIERYHLKIIDSLTFTVEN